MAQNPPASKLRVMVDANVLFAGSVWPRFPYEVLRHAVLGDYYLIMSERIIQEARTAIADFSTADAERLETVLTASQYQATPTPADKEIAENPTLVRDQKDIHVALAARNAKVDCLVSQDRDLTDPGEPIHKFLTVLLPARFLREKMGWTSEALEAIRHRNWEDMEK